MPVDAVAVTVGPARAGPVRAGPDQTPRSGPARPALLVGKSQPHRALRHDSGSWPAHRSGGSCHPGTRIQPNRPGLPAGRHRIGRANASRPAAHPDISLALRCPGQQRDPPILRATGLAGLGRAGQPAHRTGGCHVAGRPQAAADGQAHPAGPGQPDPPSCTLTRRSGRPGAAAELKGGRAGRLADSGAECECDPDHHEEHERAEHHVVEHRRRQQLHHSGPGHVR